MSILKYMKISGQLSPGLRDDSESGNMKKMDYGPDEVPYLSVTAIVVKDGKYLIARRSEKEKNFPGLWTV